MMHKWFKEVKTIEELRKKYRELLKKYHPDNPEGSVEITQQINSEYDRLFAVLSRENSSDRETPPVMMKPKIEPKTPHLKKS